MILKGSHIKLYVNACVDTSKFISRLVFICFAVALNYVSCVVFFFHSLLRIWFYVSEVHDMKEKKLRKLLFYLIIVTKTGKKHTEHGQTYKVIKFIVLNIWPGMHEKWSPEKNDWRPCEMEMKSVNNIDSSMIQPDNSHFEHFPASPLSPSLSLWLPLTFPFSFACTCRSHIILPLHQKPTVFCVAVWRTCVKKFYSGPLIL